MSPTNCELRHLPVHPQKTIRLKNESREVHEILDEVEIADEPVARSTPERPKPKRSATKPEDSSTDAKYRRKNEPDAKASSDKRRKERIEPERDLDASGDRKKKRAEAKALLQIKAELAKRRIDLNRRKEKMDAKLVKWSAEMAEWQQERRAYDDRVAGKSATATIAEINLADSDSD